ncbi:MAG: FG-GAP-like repeat-containing protein [Planctomycetes bacterium]|nr:FG-GAP-like repeat-containing protein [Planctomycetota bacterium]
MTIPLRAISVALLLPVVLTDTAPQNLPQSCAPPLSTADVSSLIVGEFSGDTQVDAVVLADGKPVLRDAVEVQQTCITANVTGVDIATLHGGGANGRDRVALVGPSGLWLVEFHESTTPGTWTATVTNLRDSTTKWALASTVRCADVDGINGPDIVAVTPTRICVITADGSGGWNADTNFTAAAGITGLELVDWDGSSAKEIAICGNWGVAIWRPTGTFVSNLAWGAGKVLIEALAEPAPGRERLAMVGTNTSTGAQSLGVLWYAAPPYVTFDGPTALGTEGVVRLASGDWNGDGYGDLFLNRTTSASVRVLLNRGTGTGAVLGNSTSLSIPVGNPARPLAVQDGGLDVLDVDHDLDADIVCAIQGAYTGGNHALFDPRFSAVDIGYSSRNPHSDWWPWYVGAHSLPAPDSAVVFDPVTGEFTIQFKGPKEAISGASFEYFVWRTPSIDSLANATPVVGPITLTITATNVPMPSSFFVDTSVASFPERYTVIGRQVRRSGSGAIEAESASLRLTIYSHALEAAMATDPYVVVTSKIINTQHPDDPSIVGVGTPVPPVPPDRRPPP